jgi:inner membrane protein
MNDALYGLKFMQTNNVYKESTRAVKYEIMFVLLTFIMIFMMEILYKKRLHPFQYILIGFALVIFYLLLLSLSEQIGFNFAYLVSAFTIIVMISAYCKKVLQSGKFAIICGTMLSFLYMFLFILLKNQDYSLLLGSLGILLILGLIMYFTRNINWYDEDNS